MQPIAECDSSSENNPYESISDDGENSYEIPIEHTINSYISMRPTTYDEDGPIYTTILDDDGHQVQGTDQHDIYLKNLTSALMKRYVVLKTPKITTKSSIFNGNADVSEYANMQSNLNDSVIMATTDLQSSTEELHSTTNLETSDYVDYETILSEYYAKDQTSTEQIVSANSSPKGLHRPTVVPRPTIRKTKQIHLYVNVNV